MTPSFAPRGRKVLLAKSMLLQKKCPRAALCARSRGQAGGWISEVKRGSIDGKLAVRQKSGGCLQEPGRVLWLWVELDSSTLGIIV